MTAGPAARTASELPKKSPVPMAPPMAIIAIWRVVSRRASPSSPSRIAAVPALCSASLNFSHCSVLIAANVSSRRNLHGLPFAHHEVGAVFHRRQHPLHVVKGVINMEGDAQSIQAS